MTGEILKELTAVKDINEVTSDQILIWAKELKAQRVQKRGTGQYKRCQGMLFC